LQEGDEGATAMTVKIFVARDSEGREWSPDHEHEVKAITEMLKLLWASYHHLSSVYCIVANMRQPNADFVIFSERGLGIVELKHHFGKITMAANGTWYAGAVSIKGGTHLTPYHQLQSYADVLRRRLLPMILPLWLKRTPERWNEVKCQLALCFTNPQADTDPVKIDLTRSRVLQRKPWESSFEVIGPREIVQWALKLRFGIDQGREKDFEPLRLEPSTIENAIGLVLGATAWTEVIPSMPASQSYGYLTWHSKDGEQKFNLEKDEVIIGRSRDCDWVTPDSFRQVSKRHCKITRGLQGVQIEDLGSTNGTFVNNKLLKKPVPLSSGQVVTLCGPLANDKAFRFQFNLRDSAGNDTTESSSTEHA
jgi:hypothetical protein